MINLIPNSAKKSIQKEYWVRVVSVWMILLSIALVFSAIVTLPSYVLISSQVLVYEQSAAEAVQKVEDYKLVSKKLIQSTQQAKFALDENTLDSFAGYIFLFEDLEGVGISINEIEIAREESSVKPIIVSGIADNRQELASFRDRILEVENVSAVDLPISNLAKDREIPFSLTVTILKE